MDVEDTELLGACLEGRREAWDELVDRYSPYIYFLVHATLRKHSHRYDDDAVEEIHNTVFLALLEDDMRRLRSFRGDNGCSLRSWLRVITIHRTIDYLKSLRPTTSLDAEDADGLKLLDKLADDAPSVEDFMERLQEPQAAELIGLAVEKLSAADHRLYELFFVRELESKEVAEELGISAGAVYTRKCRMLDRMSKTLASMGRLGEHRGRGTL